MRALVAEWRKAVTLPAVWIGAGVAVGASALITLLNAGGMRADGGATGSVQVIEGASNSMLLAVVGVVIVGVVVATSEYAPADAESGGGRQITTTLAAVPRRVAMLAAKALTIASLAVVILATAWAVNCALSAALIGERAPAASLDAIVDQGVREVLYGTLMALIALAIGVLARSGVVPLAILILNSSVVSLSLLLCTLTPLAFWLPDAAGRAMVMDIALFRDTTAMPPPAELNAFTGGLAMAVWVSLLLVAAGAALRRRDA